MAVVAALWSVPQTALAQSDSTAAATDTVLDPSPFTTCRAAGMGGALSTLADHLDAVYYNPAGIGGTGLEGKRSDPSSFKGFYFPYAAASLNQNATTVRSEFNAQHAQNDANTGAAILDANAGKRQYARVSVVPLGLLLSNTAIVPIIDHQLAAVPEGDASGQVKLRYRSFTGLMLGGSVSDPAHQVSLGVSQAFGTIEETSGMFNYLDMVDAYQRKKILKENRNNYVAKSMNAGMTIRVPKAANPAFSLVARNLGNTSNTSSGEGKEPLIYDEDLTAGFSISPSLGNIGRLNFLIESGYLTQKHMAARKKMRGGMELLLGGGDSKSLIGLRTGGNDAGWSAGVHINLGLIGLEAESHAIDIGANNSRVIERRSSAILFINLGSM